MLGDNRNRAFLDPHALARLAAVPLHARRAMVGSVSGMHASPHRGASVEFAEYRRYVPGDDLRRLDWRAYGRTDRYYVKEFEADTNLRLCLVIDTSGSMGFGSTDITKLVYARRIAGSLAYLSVQQGDAVGLTCVADQVVRSIPAQRTPSHLRGIFDVLENTVAAGTTALLDRLHEFAETTAQRALVVVISDLFIEPDQLRKSLDHLRFRKHDVVLFQLLDPQELDFEFRRPTRFVDLEGSTTLMADPTEIVDQYQAALSAHLAAVERIAMESGVEYQLVRIDRDYEQVLFQFLAARTGRECTMSFLQPGLLFALPIVLLPIVIHLVNQRRFQTVQWAAMQFLLTANRLSQGHARIRRWSILIARMAAIGALIFALSRPLSSGVLGLMGGGHIDTAIVLVDRSPSMTARGTGNATKLKAALQMIVSSLETLQPGRIVMIESGNAQPLQVDAASKILRLPSMKPQAASANLPAMLEVAYDYIATERPGQCDIWIASDLRRNDWNSKSGRWKAIRQSLQALPQSVRIRLLSSSVAPTNNRSIRVSRVQPIQQNGESQLALSFSLRHDGAEVDSDSIPLELMLNGARSEIRGRSGADSTTGRQDYLVPIDQSQRVGWGSLSLGPDTVAGDNRFYFVYEPPVDRRALIVSEANTMVQPWQFAASVSPESSIACSCENIQSSQWISADFSEVALVIWHSPIPPADHPDYQLLESYVDRGGQLLFLPPESPSEDAFHGVRWGDWNTHQATSANQWTIDQGLLGPTAAGERLPVDQLKIFRTCRITGAIKPIARLVDNSPFVARAAELPNVYFLGTSAAANASSLASDGVVLYAIIHRLLATGVASLGQTQMRVAGNGKPDSDLVWKQIAGDSSALSIDYPGQAGVYQVGERFIAVNRSRAEDSLATIDAAEVDELFAGLDLNRLEFESDDTRSIVQEIWRLALIMMLAALVVESVLTIPRRPRSSMANPTGVSAA